ILVPLLNPKFAPGLAAKCVRTSGFAAPVYNKEPPCCIAPWRSNNRFRAQAAAGNCLRQLHGLDKGAARREVFVAHMAKAGCELRAIDTRRPHDTLFGDYSDPRLSQKRDVRRMWLAIACMPPPSRRQLPERVRARPMTVPLRRNSDRLESDLMRHDPTRLQPA